MEFLKTVFGDKALTWDEFAEAIKADKDIKIANIATGEYVGKDKFKAKEDEVKELKGQISTLQETVNGYEGVDVAALKQSVADWETKYNADMAALQKNVALKMALSGMVHDPDDIVGLLDMSTVEIDDKGNLKTNIDDMVKSIKETKPYLFKEQKKAPEPVVSGAKPADPQVTNPTGGAPDELAQWRSELGL